MQSLYSGLLKRIGYVDVAVIAAGFVLRAVAGAAAMDVRISPWLLWCAFLISMFLALCKRRHEKAIECESRAALASYHPVILDTLIIISALATFGVYLWYTLSADTVARFRTRALSITSIFVALGIIRYLYLLFTKKDVGRPEKILLSDKIIWLILFGYSISAVLAVWSGR
jgi:4-hydroxybenzoate polyprenyltransferase